MAVTPPHLPLPEVILDLDQLNFRGHDVFPTRPERPALIANQQTLLQATANLCQQFQQFDWSLRRNTRGNMDNINEAVRVYRQISGQVLDENRSLFALIEQFTKEALEQTSGHIAAEIEQIESFRSDSVLENLKQTRTYIERILARLVEVPVNPANQLWNGAVQKAFSLFSQRIYMQQLNGGIVQGANLETENAVKALMHAYGLLIPQERIDPDVAMPLRRREYKLLLPRRGCKLLDTPKVHQR